MKIELHPHAKQRLAERGATEEEVTRTVKEGRDLFSKVWQKGIPPEETKPWN